MKPKRILTVVGARPQFVKAAVVSRALRREGFNGKVEEILVHTGQHYDENMSQVFFEQMEIPHPDINLGIGSGSHGRMTGRMLEELEAAMMDKKPDVVLTYGDTNSTLAGALAASKLHVPVAHVEAGLRSYNRKMPEEQHRVLTDHLAEMLFCPTATAVDNLAKEGIRKGVIRTGDVMLDASLHYRGRARLPEAELPDEFILVTIHRAESTADTHRLRTIIECLNTFQQTAVVFPIHPRTRKALETVDLDFSGHIHLIPPVGYLEMLALEEACRFVVTDSGGVQKEAYFFRKPCITIRSETEWVETVEAGANVVVGYDRDLIMDALMNPPVPVEWPDLFGDGTTGEAIVASIL